MSDHWNSLANLLGTPSINPPHKKSDRTKTSSVASAPAPAAEQDLAIDFKGDSKARAEEIASERPAASHAEAKPAEPRAAEPRAKEPSRLRSSWDAVTSFFGIQGSDSQASASETAPAVEKPSRRRSQRTESQSETPTPVAEEPVLTFSEPKRSRQRGGQRGRRDESETAAPVAEKVEERSSSDDASSSGDRPQRSRPALGSATSREADDPERRSHRRPPRRGRSEEDFDAPNATSEETTADRLERQEDRPDRSRRNAPRNDRRGGPRRDDARRDDPRRDQPQAESVRSESTPEDLVNPFGRDEDATPAKSRRGGERGRNPDERREPRRNDRGESRGSGRSENARVEGTRDDKSRDDNTRDHASRERGPSDGARREGRADGRSGGGRGRSGGGRDGRRSDSADRSAAEFGAKSNSDRSREPIARDDDFGDDTLEVGFGSSVKSEDRDDSGRGARSSGGRRRDADSDREVGEDGATARKRRPRKRGKTGEKAPRESLSDEELRVALEQEREIIAAVSRNSKIPSWAEAIGTLVATNVENHNRPSSGYQRGRGRGNR